MIESESYDIDPQNVRQRATSEEREHNKSLGSFYTPLGLARDIANTVLDAWFKNQSNPRLETLYNIKILDPSVGDGVFLIAAGEWLLSKRIEFKDMQSHKYIMKDIVRKSLYGVDLQADAITACRQRLSEWIGCSDSRILFNLEQGHSLIGRVRDQDQFIEASGMTQPFHWHEYFKKVFEFTGGFDVILGNPPYGNILSGEERESIAANFEYDVHLGRNGTWNTSALFIVRAQELLRDGGYLGFLVPNSVIRVKQFSKTREFLLNEMSLWEIADEGSPFDDVTLETVSIFARSQRDLGNHNVRVISRRPDIREQNEVPWHVLASSKVFPLYYDELFAGFLRKGQRGIIKATRGRDIPKEHVTSNMGDQFTIPYATSGKSVKRYRFDEEHLFFTNDWFTQDESLTYSYENELLLATKNYPYPRCVLKPKGMIHGGGAVRIISSDKHIAPEVIGLILNSRLMQFICIRYLTNYSQLTTCMNTGIMEDIPFVLPNHQEIYVKLFRALQKLNSDRRDDDKSVYILDTIANALVYLSYITGNDSLERELLSLMDNLDDNVLPDSLAIRLDTERVKELTYQILSSPIVKAIDASPRMIRR
ncbi:MAG: Eco57I restriction-modification methylase domain-containing protein [Candidatus Thorarchaeota archaeon]